MLPYHPDFLQFAERDDWFERSQALAWERGEIYMYGRAIQVPREEALYGDDLCYQYRGQVLRALPWPDFLLDARDRILGLSGFRLNFAVGNRYLTGRDSIGWHSDDFPQIGEHPPVASLSLGGTRRFKLSSTFRILGRVAGEVDQALEYFVGAFSQVRVGSGHGESLIGP